MCSSKKENSLNNHVEAYKDDFPYDLDNRLILNWYPRRIVELAEGDSLLELGLGHGYSSRIFAEHFKKHVILEGSSPIINNFKKNHSELKTEIIHTYFEDYNSKQQYDVIVMGFVLEHVNDPLTILKKYKDFLKKNGSLFIAVPNGAALNRQFGYTAGLLDDLMQLSEADLRLGHKRFFTLDSLRTLVEETGLVEKKVEGIFLKPITTAQIHDLKLSGKILQAMLKVGVEYPELSVGILMKTELAP